MQEPGATHAQARVGQHRGQAPTVYVGAMVQKPALKILKVVPRPSIKSEAEARFSSISCIFMPFSASREAEEDFGSEREMLLAAVAGLREAAEAALCRAQAAEAAVKQVLEAHLKAYKEQMESEVRRTVHREVAEAP